MLHSQFNYHTLPVTWFYFTQNNLRLLWPRNSFNFNFINKSKIFLCYLYFIEICSERKVLFENILFLDIGRNKTSFFNCWGGDTFFLSTHTLDICTHTKYFINLSHHSNFFFCITALCPPPTLTPPFPYHLALLTFLLLEHTTDKAILMSISFEGKFLKRKKYI